MKKILLLFCLAIIVFNRNLQAPNILTSPPQPQPSVISPLPPTLQAPIKPSLSVNPIQGQTILTNQVDLSNSASKVDNRDISTQAAALTTS